jgi:hypothetical protein
MADESKVILLPDGKFKDFERIGISTETVIALTNLQIDNTKFFQYVPITDFTPIEKKRGRKKRYCVQVPQVKLPYGSVISVQKGNSIRGAILKNKQKKNKTFFLHSVTTVFVLKDNKQINVKVSNNGRFQMTGCKNESHYVETIILLMSYLKQIEEFTGEKIWKFSSGEKLEVTFNTVMKNMDFNIGFSIHRDKLDYFINTGTDFRSIFEGSISTGVNIKVPTVLDQEEKLLKIAYNMKTGEIERSNVPYSSYYSSLEDKEKRKEQRKEKYHTFLVFSSGSIIMSSRGSDMKPVFENLVKTLIKNRTKFEDQFIGMPVE